MPGAVFLSASVPHGARGDQFPRSDVVAISAAVQSLVHVTLGRRLLVWGGHPAITPMIRVIAEALGVEYGQWVKLYQSEYFKEEFPEENESFDNVVYTRSFPDDRAGSLRKMREQMFADNSFDTAVFIGGMEGVVDEAHLLHVMQPGVRLIAATATGGAARALAEAGISEGFESADYISTFYEVLDVSPTERRYRTVEEQPSDVSAHQLKRVSPDKDRNVGVVEGTARKTARRSQIGLKQREVLGRPARTSKIWLIVKAAAVEVSTTLLNAFKFWR